MSNTKSKTNSKTLRTPSNPVAPLTGSHVTLEQLMARTQAPDAQLRSVVLSGHVESDFAELGQGFAPETVIHAAVAFAGHVMVQEQALSPTQRALLIGHNPVLTALLIHETAALRSLALSTRLVHRQGANEDGSKKSHSKRQFREALGLRDQVYDAAVSMLGKSQTDRREALDRFVGTASTPEELATGLRGLARLLGEWRLDKSSGTTSQMDLLGLNQAMIQSLDERASALESVAQAASSRALSTRVSQRSLHVQKGIVVALVGMIFRAFRGASRRDGSIVVPPLGGVKNAFMRPAKKRASKGKEGNGQEQNKVANPRDGVVKNPVGGAANDAVKPAA